MTARSPAADAPLTVIVMGVSGSGKSTIGRLLARRLRARFLDADDFHSAENVDKMRRGVALSDRDRAPWLARLNQALRDHAARGESVVLACSALKRSYRDRLMEGLPATHLVYLRGSRALLAARLSGREGHFMSPALLDSQLATLEEPRHAIIVDVDSTPEGITAAICEALQPAK
jgi:gluconokinase